MRVAVVGSRSLCIDIAPYVPKEATEILSVGMPGISLLASKYADAQGLPKMIIQAEHLHIFKHRSMWQGKVVIEAADMIVAIWDGQSHGTQRAIAYAREIGKPINVHVIDGK